jgi:hypothetical protein
MGGVVTGKVPTTLGVLPTRRVKGQGSVAVARAGRQVIIFAAGGGEGDGSDAALGTLVDEALAGAKLASPAAPAGQGAVDMGDPKAAVPMYLDRWDRYGFRFYYWPWQCPKGPDGKDLLSYDPLPEFDFLRRTQSGLVLWEKPHPVDGAEGVLDYPWSDWAIRLCQAARLAVGINVEVGNRPTWLLNRCREQEMGRMPKYVGGWYGLRSFESILSWSAPAREAALAQAQKAIRVLGRYDNVVNWLEPCGEMYHGACDVLIEHGPVADRGYREFLRERYGTPQAVGKRWHGEASPIKSWDDVHLPELASFAGWDGEAVDLTGPWRVSYDAAYGQAASAAVDLDDSAWPVVTAPGHDIAMYLPKRPAVWRRQITIDPAWRARHERVWLYVWDINDTRPRKQEPRTDVLVFVNGQAAPESNKPASGREAHWAAVEVTAALRPGANVIAISLPQGYLGYRTYLSPQSPRQYPGLGEHLNAQWADFMDFSAWSRVRAVRRGAQAIRQVDADRPITFMHPDEYSAGIKRSCQDYGGVFHNTGYMAGVWADMNSMQMAGSDLPTDVEPGSGAVDLPDFKRFMGRWSTEGIQGVDYFIHVGDVLWKPEILDYFQKTQNLWHLLGKYHTPKAEIALLMSDRLARLGGWPWEYDASVNLPSGYWRWDLPRLLLPEYPREGVDEGDFDTGRAGQYRVILDTNTSVMDEELLKGIEAYVRGGGIFVTFAQTGRHSSTRQDAWPISRLTGYSVTKIDPHNAQGQIIRNHKLTVAAGQDVFHGDDWPTVAHANGLTLRKDAADCQDLLLWEEGGVAVGMRKLGKGWIVHNGVKFAHDRGCGDPRSARRFLGELLGWAGLARVPATAAGVLMRHFVSNNGLYDVWAMWNESSKPVTTDLVFRDGRPRERAIDANSLQPLPVTQAAGGPRVAGLAFGPWQTHVLRTERRELAGAPMRWLQLQRDWWRGNAPLGDAIAQAPDRLTVDLTEDWTMKMLEPGQDAAALAQPAADDSAWPRRDVSVLTFEGPEQPRRVLFRRKFTVPAHWNSGRVALWVRTDGGTTYVESGRVYIDGKVAYEKLGDGIPGMEFDGLLKPGTTHVVALEVVGKRSLLGVRGPAWLAWKPAASRRQDLAGPWAISTDNLHFTPPSALPGPADNMTAARRVVRIEGDAKGQPRQNVVFHAAADNYAIVSVIVNGRCVPRFAHLIGTEVDLNITPFVRPGQDNELILITRPGKLTIREASLDFYDADKYP